MLGLQSTCWDEAVKIAGADPDFHRRDLYEAIDAGNFPEWDSACRFSTRPLPTKQPYDVLDATKLIPEEVIPVEIIGRMTLNRNVDNFFAETEQVAFMPSNIIPGIDFSNDPLLQGRLFSYLDTQKSRLGHGQLPPDPDQRAELSVPQHAARRHDADADPHGPRQLRAQQPGGRG